MAINVDELGRFGQMILNKGVYRGKRIVSEKFVEAALTPWIKTDIPLYTSKNNDTFDYGYYFWVDAENKVTFLLGILGQLCVIIPEKDAVVSMLALEQKSERLGSLLWKDVVLAL